MENIESVIRDKLALQLELLEEGLELLDIEKYLPNRQGTRGFIDLLARDKNGKYVIIELKRSEAASREALHEVLKYLEGLKLNYSIRDSELRVFIVSTEWRELMVSFSSFVKRVSVVVQGFKLEVDADHSLTNATTVSPLELAQDRIFAPWHELNLYKTESSLEKGIASYEKSCREKGIENYVLLKLVPPLEFRTRPARALAILEMAQFISTPLKKSREQIIAELPTYSYILYFSPLQLSEDACWDAIKRRYRGEELKEFELTMKYVEEETRLFYLHEKLYEMSPAIFFDDAEIGTPAKISKILDGEDVKLIEILRYGTLKANIFLSEESILNDLRGLDGNRLQTYHKEFCPSNRAELNEVRISVQRCLRENPLWRAQILRVIDEFLPVEPDFKATIHIYNPGNLCLSLFKSIDESNLEYVPGYAFLVEKNGAPHSIFFGKMWPTGKKASFSSLLESFHHGQGRLFLSSLNWGGYESRDVEISEHLGMTYKTFKVVFNGNDRSFWELTDICWRAVEPFDEHSGFREFKKENSDFVLDVCDYYSAHWDGVLVQHDLNKEFVFRT
ncbi:MULTISPECIES: endonuclease NucS domain-containing protein [unclassified Pseudomonas]|uniref:endonuclease NucS domain-containing protein n=1 Tax=unclassified Pseudomonas TaxID=196821 RepID=UPI000A7908A3|nr:MULTISPECIES: endonuclease NucS domain-containing protein [unclassified Pseudomonas]